MIRVDDAELRRFAEDLGKVPMKVARGIPPVVSKGALNIKQQLSQDLAGSAHFRGASRAVSYDLLDGGFAAEIGPSSESGSPGNIANVAYFGGSNGGGGTVADPREALEAEGERFLKALADLAEESF